MAKLDSRDISTCRQILHYSVDRDARRLTNLPNVEFVFDVNEFVRHLDDYGVAFGYPPENFDIFLQATSGESLEDGVGLDLPIWGEGVDPTDVEIDIWIDISVDPHRIFVKGHRIP